MLPVALLLAALLLAALLATLLAALIAALALVLLRVTARAAAALLLLAALRVLSLLALLTLTLLLLILVALLLRSHVSSFREMSPTRRRAQIPATVVPAHFVSRRGMWLAARAHARQGPAPLENVMRDMGYLIPVWILGAPLVLVLIEWMRTPRGRMTRSDRIDERIG